MSDLKIITPETLLSAVGHLVTFVQNETGNTRTVFITSVNEMSVVSGDEKSALYFDMTGTKDKMIIHE